MRDKISYEVRRFALWSTRQDVHAGVWGAAATRQVSDAWDEVSWGVQDAIYGSIWGVEISVWCSVRDRLGTRCGVLYRGR
jgi:hypothetical protein